MKELYDLKPIIGEKVILRPITMEDTPLIVRWRNNPNVRKRFIFQECFTEEMHKNWMDTKVATGEVVQYIIELRSTGAPVGSVYLRDIDETNHSAEYGIFIGENETRGMGVGSETAKLFVKSMFTCLHLHKIYLRVFEDNPQACASYIKAGFQLEGVSRDMVYLNGEYKNIVFMSVLEGEV